jgi:hypothetical protein
MVVHDFEATPVDEQAIDQPVGFSVVDLSLGMAVADRPLYRGAVEQSPGALVLGVVGPDEAFDSHRPNATHRLGRESRLALSQSQTPCIAGQTFLQDRSRNPTNRPVQGPPTAAITFTRNNNRISSHAKAGKQARCGNHPALLRSCSKAAPIVLALSCVPASHPASLPRDQKTREGRGLILNRSGAGGVASEIANAIWATTLNPSRDHQQRQACLRGITTIRSNHAKAGKPVNRVSQNAQLRSSHLSGADCPSSAKAGKQPRNGNHPAQLRSCSKAAPQSFLTQGKHQAVAVPASSHSATPGSPVRTGASKDRRRHASRYGDRMPAPGDAKGSIPNEIKNTNHFCWRACRVGA